MKWNFINLDVIYVKSMYDPWINWFDTDQFNRVICKLNWSLLKIAYKNDIVEFDTSNTV